MPLASSERQQADDDPGDREQRDHPDAERQAWHRPLLGLPRQALRGRNDHGDLAVLAAIELREAGLELRGERSHRRKAPRRILLQCPVDSLGDPDGNVASNVQDARRGFVDVLERDGHEALAGERHLAREHLVEDDAQRVHVGVRADRAAARLLRRDVGARAEHRAGLRHALLDVE